MEERSENEKNEYKILGYWKAPRVFQYLNNPIAYTLIFCIFATITCKINAAFT